MSNVPQSWKEAIARLPGIALQDQYPEGARLAISIEASGGRTWRIHSVHENNGAFDATQTRPLSAPELYRTLEKFFEAVGDPPELSDRERSTFDLPRKEDCYRENLLQKMPGTWLGSSESMESEFGWTSVYSVKTNEDGSYTLYTCTAGEEDEDTADDLDIEKAGTYDLSQLLNELNVLGFERNRYAFLLSIEAAGWNEVQSRLPGVVLPCPDFVRTGVAISIGSSNEAQWNLYVTDRTSENQYTIAEHTDLDAKQTYRTCYEILGSIPTGSVRERLNLPSLEILFSKTLRNKMKGNWLGEVSGEDESGRPQVRFVSIKTIKPPPSDSIVPQADVTWQLDYVKSEDMLSAGRGHRKFEVHSTGSIHPQEIQSFIDRYDPELDLLDLCDVMTESSIPEASNFAHAILDRLESSS